MAMRGLAGAAVMCSLEGNRGRLYMMGPAVETKISTNALIALRIG